MVITTYQIPGRVIIGTAQGQVVSASFEYEDKGCHSNTHRRPWNGCTRQACGLRGFFRALNYRTQFPPLSTPRSEFCLHLIQVNTSGRWLLGNSDDFVLWHLICPLERGAPLIAAPPGAGAAVSRMPAGQVGQGVESRPRTRETSLQSPSRSPARAHSGLGGKPDIGYRDSGASG